MDFSIWQLWCSSVAVKRNLQHSRPHRPRSFWSAPGVKTSGRLQNRKSAIHGLIVKYDQSDWLRNTERVPCACSEIGSGQRSRSLGQTRRIAASGDENESTKSRTIFLNFYYSLMSLQNFSSRFKRFKDVGQAKFYQMNLFMARCTHDLHHDSCHVYFHVIMQIRHMICEGANKLKLIDFSWFISMYDNCFHSHALVSVVWRKHSKFFAISALL